MKTPIVLARIQIEGTGDAYIAGKDLATITADVRQIFNRENPRITEVAEQDIPPEFYWSKRFVLEHPEVWVQKDGTHLMIRNWEQYDSIRQFYPKPYEAWARKVGRPLNF